MLAIQDIESLKNHGTVLSIPFFSAACVMGTPYDAGNDPIFGSSQHWLSVGGWGVFLLLVVGAVAAVLVILDVAILWLHGQTGDSVVMPWLGFASITLGVFALSYASDKVPASPLNLFWHLGFLAYGFSLISRASRF